MDLDHPAVGWASRVLGTVVASIVVVVGFFGGSLTEALGIGLGIGVAYAVASEVGARLLP